ncbi:hypothetical protein D5085_07580 [Ectothiorhodospiraceae bacterium BW-2]|nr:hypothetical protein D5085_07580 [Ectothiorhodospiraceae bacterium BW-2]
MLLDSNIFIYAIQPQFNQLREWCLQRKMSLGDAVIAATALEYQQTLATRNIDDFEWIEGLRLINPMEGESL